MIAANESCTHSTFQNMENGSPSTSGSTRFPNIAYPGQISASRQTRQNAAYRTFRTVMAPDGSTSCPYAYLSSTQVEALAERTGAELVVKPMLLGGVFRALDVPQKLFSAHGAEKARHNANDLVRYAKLFGAEYSMPDGHPFRTVEALRAVLVAGTPLPLIHRIYRAYWVEGRDIGDREVLAQLLTETGHDAADVLAKIDAQEVKDDLRRRTDEAIERGVFGAPAFFVGDELFWGQDRIADVERALGGSPAAIASDGAFQHPVDFFFDYSSPFAYLGTVRASRQLGDHATWRPMLLGAVFKAIGQVMVPLYEMNEPKRKFMGADLMRQAATLDVPFKWPSRFPMNSILPLRVTLATGTESAEAKELVLRIFTAYWGEDRDISDPKVIAELATECGFDGEALVANASEQKQALFDATNAAVEAQAFGAPTTVVKPEGRPASLYWGSDRVDLAVAAARGRDELL